MRSRQPRHALRLLLGVRFWAVLCLVLPSIAFGRAPTDSAPLAVTLWDAVRAAPEAPEPNSKLPETAVVFAGEGESEEEEQVRTHLDAVDRAATAGVVASASVRFVRHAEGVLSEGLQPRSGVHNRGPPRC